MLIGKYVNYLSENTDLSGNTVLSYRYDIEGFLTYCEKNECKEISKDAVMAYVIYMKNSGKSMATVLRCVSAIKNFSKYLADSGVVEINPCEGIILPKFERKISVKRPSFGEISQLLSCIKKDSLKGMRDYAMICLAASSGIQASEITELDIDNFNGQDMLIEVMKNGCKQFYPLSEDVCMCIDRYVEHCRPLIISENESSLFVNTNGKRMTRQGFWKIIRMYKEKASIKSSVTPRTIRYSLPG